MKAGDPRPLNTRALSVDNHVRPEVHVVLRCLQDSLLIAGLTLLGLWASVWVESHAFQYAGERRLEALLGQEPSASERRSVTRRALSPTASAVDPARGRAQAARSEACASGWIGSIEIPRLGLKAAVAEGSDAKTLKHAVGHVRWTAFPGEEGNVGLAGHRDSFFRKLEGVRNHDLIRVSTADGVFSYRVESTLVVEPSRVDVLAPAGGRLLTLVTCFPFHYVGAAPKRFIVRARQAEAEPVLREMASERPPEAAGARNPRKRSAGG